MVSAEEISPERLAERQADQEFDDPINIQYTRDRVGTYGGR
jgi:hypothetical protein